MKMIMQARFKLLQKGCKKPLTDDDIGDRSVGGFNFTVEGKTFGFDFDASACTMVEPGVFEYESGYGPFFNDFEISEDFEEEIREAGLDRLNLTAEFMASVSNINEFFVWFTDKDDTKECDNGGNDYYVELLEMGFTDRDTSKSYDVREEVIKKYNKENKMSTDPA